MDNITNEQGWSLTWNMSKLSYSERFRFNKSIPTFAFRFHRPISICTISFDVEAQIEPQEVLSSPNISIFIGATKGKLLHQTESPSKHWNGLLHYKFIVKDYGITVPGFIVSGGGFSFVNETIRRITFSNLVIHEKFDHHDHAGWLSEFHKGAETSLTSPVLKERLEKNLPAELEFPLLADDHRCPRMSEVNLHIMGATVSDDRKLRLREGVNVIVQSGLPYPHMNYFYRYLGHPSLTLGFVSYLNFPTMIIRLANSTGDLQW